LAAVRYGQPGVAVTIVVVSVLAIWGTVHGSGPFAQASVHESLLFLQTFMGTVAATALVLGAVITERYRAEIALRESEERYRRLIEICPDAVALIAPDGAILLCNEQAAVVQGYPRDELTGRNAIDLFAAKDRPSADRWLKLSDWIATAGQALSEAEDDLASLITWWDEALADLGGDPSRTEWATFRPLRLSREEDWSDWLAHLMQTSTTGTLARALFGEWLAKVTDDFARPEVKREQWTKTKDRRADLLVRWRGGPISHVEVKIGDENFDKTYETSKGLAEQCGSPRVWTNHVLISDTALDAWKDCVERHPHETEVGVLTWRSVAEALRKALLASEPLTWRVWAYSFSGAVEQTLLGYHPQKKGFSAYPTSTAGRLAIVLNEFELMRNGKER